MNRERCWKESPDWLLRTLAAVQDLEMSLILSSYCLFCQSSSFQMSDLKDPGVYKPLVIGFMLMFFQQMTGINAIMFYAQNIFEQAHFKVRSLDIFFNFWSKSDTHNAQHLVFFLFFRIVIWRQWSWVWFRSSLQQLLHSSWTKLEGRSFWSSQVFLVKLHISFWKFNVTTMKPLCYLLSYIYNQLSK